MSAARSLCSPGQKPASGIFFLLVSMIFLAGSAIAAPEQPVPPLPATPVSLGGVLQVLFGLIVVLATVAGSAWLLKRLAPGQVSAGGAIRLVGGIAVGPKERVVVVEVDETWLVVGVAPGQVSALHAMPRPESFQNVNPQGGADPRFSLWIREVMRRSRAGKGGS